MKEGDAPVSATLGKLFGSPRKIPPVNMNNLHLLPGSVEFIDDEHPDRPDWRNARLGIDTREGRWMHFSVLPKAYGRSVTDVTSCPITQARLALFLNRIFDTVLPNRKGDILKYPDGIVSTFAWQDDTPTVSFHGNAKSQAAIRALSNHNWVQLNAAWNDIKDHQLRRRAAGTT
jgi:hypothetical protein